MNPFVKVAEKQGFVMWYDRSIRLWTVTKEGYETEYYTKNILEEMGLYDFNQFLSRKEMV